MHFHACQWLASLSEVEEKVKGQRPQRANLLLHKMAKNDNARIPSLCQYGVVMSQTRQYKALAYNTVVLEG